MTPLLVFCVKRQELYVLKSIFLRVNVKLHDFQYITQIRKYAHILINIAKFNI